MNTAIEEINTITTNALLSNANVTNPRYNRDQFDKYIDADDIRSYAKIAKLNGDNELDALAIVDRYAYITNMLCTTFILEIQSIKSKMGHGRMLLEHIIETYDNVWLLADPSADDSLKDYYRSFENLIEYTIKSKRYSDHIQDISFFISKKFTQSNLRTLYNYINATFIE